MVELHQNGSGDANGINSDTDGIVIFLILIFFAFDAVCLQCSETVGWVSGRASGL